jgi:hypothetical protein
MKCYCVLVGSVPKRSVVNRVTPFLSLVSPILRFSTTEASIHLTSRETRKGTQEPAKEGLVSGNVSNLRNDTRIIQQQLFIMKRQSES